MGLDCGEYGGIRHGRGWGAASVSEFNGQQEEVCQLYSWFGNQRGLQLGMHAQGQL